MKKIVIILLIFLFGCDLFTNRDPEEPDAARSNYIPATSSDILFSNLKSSMQEKVLENYMACFVDPSFSEITYVFIPSNQAVVRFPSLVEWNIPAERQYFNNLINKTSTNAPIILDLQNEIKNTTSDSAVFQYDYTVTLASTDENLPEVYRGNVKFYIYLDSRNQWAIGKWEDLAIDSHPSWSELKGAMY